MSTKNEKEVSIILDLQLVLSQPNNMSLGEIVRKMMFQELEKQTKQKKHEQVH